MSDERQFLRFDCGAGDYVVPIAAVVEVLPMVELKHGGESDDPSWTGLLEYRGDLVSVYALAPTDRAATADPDHNLLVLRGADELIAWVVRNVHGVVDVPPKGLRHVQAGAGADLEVAQIDDDVIRVLRPGDAAR